MGDGDGLGAGVGVAAGAAGCCVASQAATPITTTITITAIATAAPRDMAGRALAMLAPEDVSSNVQNTVEQYKGFVRCGCMNPTPTV